MRLKYLLSILLFAGIFFSCAHEELLVAPTVQKELTSSLRLDIGQVGSQTKAYNQETGGLTTKAVPVQFFDKAEEKQINNLYIVAFKDIKFDESDNIIEGTVIAGSERYITNAADLAPVDGYITVKDIRIEFGKVLFIAIANFDNMFKEVNENGKVVAKSGLTKYSDYQKLITEHRNGTLAADFKANELMKYGEGYEVCR
ncbi:hypothetical protein M2137_002136 [Parabacteroides sp. PFB2-10]|uniref:hypothetical protein n=1 Tax=Parabacteroides sp. PFB2-10 TaxID=1742405 RepID=UPI0024758F46|nr:hypothetical protein [Parabacteroides sp. PFB2-10]MDH6313346.1 hypothetical protein [Parabacteroides sp. PFB2-10]MDL2244592.1 hypothetical protein [Parabacteroides sp. OttesenSCG-928-J18]